jgi:hypothetical protein
MVADSTRRGTLGAATAGLVAAAVGPVRIAQAQQASTVAAATSAAPAAPTLPSEQKAKPADGVDIP